MEPGLFKKITGLDVKDFELLVSLGVFNDFLMNDAVYKFKRYEDTSLSYTGIDHHQGEKVGGYDTVVSNEDYSNMFPLPQASIEAPAPIDLPKVFAPVPVVQPKPIVPRSTTRPATVTTPQVKQIDTINIKVGSVLRHKAFGAGEVTAMEGKYILVAFQGTEKRFLFPGAIMQGFLSTETV